MRVRVRVKCRGAGEDGLASSGFRVGLRVGDRVGVGVRVRVRVEKFRARGACLRVRARVWVGFYWSARSKKG